MHAMKRQILKDPRSAAIEFTQFWNPAAAPLHFSCAECAAAADSAFSELSAGASQNKKCIRICGQSGSGKSTQLFPAAAAYFNAIGARPVHIAVRNFVKYHPRLDQILRIGGPGELRENTNAFALLTLLLALEKFIAAGFDLLFETALLSPEFETYVSSMLAGAGYSSEYHMLAVPKSVSDDFILRRAAREEPGRVVLKKSVDFFYNAMLPGIAAAAEIAPDAPAVVWSAFDPSPVFVGKIGDAGLVPVIEKYRRAAPDAGGASEDDLRAAKIEWFKSRAVA
jgi:energy-coupling factor transporter ATP-binding protein EcfA2